MREREAEVSLGFRTVLWHLVERELLSIAGGRLVQPKAGELDCVDRRRPKGAARLMSKPLAAPHSCERRYDPRLPTESRVSSTRHCADWMAIVEAQFTDQPP